MVNPLLSGSSGPGSSLGRKHCVVLWARHLTPAVPLSTQAYKWVPANLMLGQPCYGLASNPGESRDTPGHFMLENRR